MATQILLLLSVIYSLYLFWLKFPDHYRDVKISAYISAITWVSGFMYYSAGFPHSTYIKDVTEITSLSFILISSLMLIRELKPHMFRYPYLVVFIPALVPLSYVLVYQTNVIRFTILYSIEGIIIFIMFLFIVSYRNKVSVFFSGISGVVLLFGALVYSLLQEYFIFYELICFFIISLGMVSLVFSVSETFSNYRNS